MTYLAYRKTLSRLDAMRRLATADLDATSDEELRAELIEDGLDPNKVAAEVGESLAAVVREWWQRPDMCVHDYDSLCKECKEVGYCDSDYAKRNPPPPNGADE